MPSSWPGASSSTHHRPRQFKNRAEQKNLDASAAERSGARE
jgi:hypothetical protein